MLLPFATIMNVDALTNLIERFDILQGVPIALLMVGLAFIIVGFNERRLTLVLLPIIYVLTAFPYYALFSPLFVSAKIFTGLFCCLILAVALKNSPYFSDVSAIPPRAVMLRRMGIALIVTVVLTLLASRPALLLPILPETAVYLNIIILLFIALGVAGIWLGKNPFSSSVGLLLFMIGFEIYHAHIDQSPRTQLILAAVNFFVVLLTSFLLNSKPSSQRSTLQKSVS